MHKEKPTSKTRSSKSTKFRRLVVMEEIQEKRFKCSCGKTYDYKRDAEQCEKRHKNEKREREIEDTNTFTITENHLRLLKNMYVDWDDCEFGAPEINPKRPYGNSDVENDIAEIINLKKSKDNVEDYDKEEASEYSDKSEYLEDLEWNEETQKKLYYLHREMQIVLQIVLVTGKFEIGTYVKTEKYDSLSWKKQKDVKQGGTD
jgi:hypothetical protein